LIFLFIVSQTQDTLTWYCSRIAFFSGQREYKQLSINQQTSDYL